MKNDFKAKFMQYFVTKIDTKAVYAGMKYGAPKLVRNIDNLFRINCFGNLVDSHLITKDAAEANEIYDRIINFYKENFDE